ncbi:trehalase-like domain-containing protein [Spirosoma pulveris]
MTPRQPDIADLAVISDRYTCALTDKEGTISWYCPGRFDHEAVLSLLVNEDLGGFWSVSTSDKSFISRQYQGRSSILQTSYAIGDRGMTITDFMPMNSLFQGICRKFSETPQALLNVLLLRKDFGLEPEQLVAIRDTIIHFPSTGLYLSASHPVKIVGERLHFEVPAGQSG